MLAASDTVNAWSRCLALAQGCSTARHILATHAVFVTHGLLRRETYALSRLILASCSLSLPFAPAGLSHASLLFRYAENPPNAFIYNTLIRAHALSPHPINALGYFLLLLRSQFATPDHHSFPFALAACANLGYLAAGTQIHAFVSKNGLASADHFVQTALLRLYVLPIDDHAEDARRLFDEVPRRDVVHWDVLMNGYLRRNLSTEALRLFRDMLDSGLEPDAFVVTTALTACAHAGFLEQGVWIHRYLERNMASKSSSSSFRDSYIGSALISMYSKCGCITEAIKVFDSMPERNSHVWSAMIGAYAMNGLAEEAMSCLVKMEERDGLRPDGIVILGVLAACAHGGLVEDGLQLLASMNGHYGVVPDHEHYSCAIDMLCRVGRLVEAVGLISRMPMKPLASVWGALLAGCKTHGNIEMAELAVAELQKIAPREGGDDEGAYVQLSNIYMNAKRREDAGRVRKLIGSRGIRKTPACSAIEVDGQVSSFVAGDQVHPQRIHVWEMLDLLMDHISDGHSVRSIGEIDWERDLEINQGN